MQTTGKFKIFNLLKILLLLQLDFPIVFSKNNPKEITVCEQYKKQLFEKVVTYSTFTLNAEEKKIVVDNCKHYDPFVTGGVPALPREFPPMAKLGYKNNDKITWVCGGTLISKRFVLTAAHCFYPLNGEINIVRLGELDFNRTDDDASPEDFGVKQTIDHPDYNDEESMYNDIGLIELDRNVVYDSYKHPACLPVNDGDEFSEFIATGWGDTSFFQAPASVLQKVKLDRFPEEKCRRLAFRIGPERLEAGLNTSTQLCAGSSVAKDTCRGDSGGPLFAYHEKFPCLYYVVGVTSAGIDKCGTPDVPGIYTRVYYYMDWIKSYIFPLKKKH